MYVSRPRPRPPESIFLRHWNELLCEAKGDNPDTHKIWQEPQPTQCTRIASCVGRNSLGVGDDDFNRQGTLTSLVGQRVANDLTKSNRLTQSFGAIKLEGQRHECGPWNRNVYLIPLH